ncbi:HPr kinase/phosphorylase [Altererythrobacter lutimaris]|uniref:Serine kinase n=1 Tax=Altererythrobacter lutimaris TaxID=2743979 RepID=A0A850HD62_9SPHN|nr:HPr kinase/phosphatase C-terminal domain-containing protein [Altererythrobacter lutimaris]NVE94638.1 serine kinase [Altererythrobacter lutimaris]
MTETHQTMQASAVSIGGRAVLIRGAPGSGKSSLALALIDRGAELIGDDGVSLEWTGNRVVASPPPNIAGLLEIRGVGIAEFVSVSAPVSLLIDLDRESERLPKATETKDLLGCAIPCLALGKSDPSSLPLRVEWGLRLHGLPKDSV